MGTVTFDRTKLHDRYGPVVRVAPNELSYCNGKAWSDIYGYQRGRELLEKASVEESDIGFGAPNILTANNVDHARFRRLIAPAFGEKALREQEPLIKSYIDLLIQRLRDRVTRAVDSGVVDMTAWFNYTTFDLIGDLTFGEPFDCLNNSTYHPWVAMIFAWLKVWVLIYVAGEFPTITRLLTTLIPKRFKESGSSHIQLTREKANRRLEMQTTRPDFISHILRHSNERGMSKAEMQSNAHIFIIGGSETTATLLSGATYYLLRNPPILRKLVAEIREAFESEDNIDYTRVQSLQYLSAVLNESLRVYPPVPGNLTRAVSKDGAIICGRWVPARTVVAVNQWAAMHSEKNFKNPFQFAPERWMGDKEYADDDHDAFQPFSYGPRNCIGRNLAFMEMRLIMARFLWNFDIELMPDSRNWAQQKIYILWEKGPLNVRLRLAHR